MLGMEQNDTVQQNHDKLAKEVEELKQMVAKLQKPAVKPVASREQTCACDWTAYCPVHSKNGQRAYKFDPDSYIAGGS